MMRVAPWRSLHLGLFTFSPQYTLLPVHFVPTTFGSRLRARVRAFHRHARHRVQMASRAPEPRHLVTSTMAHTPLPVLGRTKLPHSQVAIPQDANAPGGEHTHDQLRSRSLSVLISLAQRRTS
ncbi:hypothetical protein E2C01_083061 [Portunus trituberculatus]|uniref:Uncharacterized protein n=1 Tax=Portunus trituberculatus TaxID=210409 RepID=A0A5B7J2F9_PORTR|nr:hypothetical protein [Portunus trituberculatus]